LGKPAFKTTWKVCGTYWARRGKLEGMVFGKKKSEKTDAGGGGGGGVDRSSGHVHVA